MMHSVQSGRRVMETPKMTQGADLRPPAPDPTCRRMLASLAAGAWREGITTSELAALAGLRPEEVERHRPHLVKSLSPSEPLACVLAHHPTCESCEVDLSGRLFSLFELWETAAESAPAQEADVYARCMADLRAALGMATTYEGG